MSDQSDDEFEQAQNLKRKTVTDDQPAKRMRVTEPAAVDTLAAPPPQQPKPQPQPPQVVQSAQVVQAVPVAQPVPRTARRVIAVSVMPTALALDVRQYVNKWSCFAIDAAGAPASPGEPRWIAERRRLFTQPGRTRPDLGESEPGALTPKRGVKVTQESAKDSVNDAAGAKSMKQLPYSAGAWALHGRASGPVPKGGRRDLQLLNQLSQLLLNALKAQGVETMEVEALVVDGRILVSANEQATVKALAALDLRNLLPGYRSTAPVGPKQTTGKVNWERVKPRKIADLCTALLPDARSLDVRLPVDAAAKVGLRRLIQLQVDCQLVPDQRSQVTAILATLRATLAGNGALVRGGDQQAVAAKILDPNYAGKIITVDAVANSHAEQNLVAAAVAAALASTAAAKNLHEKLRALGPVSVAGGKRPCTTCWYTMGLARRYGLDIHCNWHPGGLWKTTTNIGTFNVADLLNVPKTELTGVLEDIGRRLGGLTQHVSDTRADAPRSADVMLQTAARSKTGELSTMDDSLSDSEDNDTQTLQPLPKLYNNFDLGKSQPLLYPESDEPMELVKDPSSSAIPGSAVQTGAQTGAQADVQTVVQPIVVPGVTPIAFTDLPEAVPDPTASVSDSALAEDDAAELDDGEPVSSYQEDDSGESAVESPGDEPDPQ
jgi:hypothetical protein